MDFRPYFWQLRGRYVAALERAQASTLL